MAGFRPFFFHGCGVQPSSPLLAMHVLAFSAVGRASGPLGRDQGDDGWRGHHSHPARYQQVASSTGIGSRSAWKVCAVLCSQPREVINPTQPRRSPQSRLPSPFPLLVQGSVFPLGRAWDVLPYVPSIARAQNTLPRHHWPMGCPPSHPPTISWLRAHCSKHWWSDVVVVPLPMLFWCTEGALVRCPSMGSRARAMRVARAVRTKTGDVPAAMVAATVLHHPPLLILFCFHPRDVVASARHDTRTETSLQLRAFHLNRSFSPSYSTSCCTQRCRWV